MSRKGITFTREQVEAWVGHTLTDDQVEELEDAAALSSIPDAFETIAHEALGIACPPCLECGEDAAEDYGMCPSCLHNALRSGWEPGK